jgi:hypothetical protein
MTHPWPTKTFEPSILAFLLYVLTAVLLWLPFLLGRVVVGLRRDG